MSGSNQDQADYWNSDSGKKWVRFQNDLDTVFAPIARRLIERANPSSGERVLDVGCGTGAVSMELVSHVGDEGSVTGLDISSPLLDHANERITDQHIGRIGYVLADAQTHAFEPGTIDLMVSRFGLMFFSDPVAAFKNISGALRPGGRLAFVSWAPPQENPWFTIPGDAAIARLGKPETTPANAPGPFGFANIDYVLGILSEAGLVDGAASVEQVDLHYPGQVEDAAFLASNIGPAARILKAFDGGPEDVEAIGRETLKAFRNFVSDDGVRVPATLNFFEARVA